MLINYNIFSILYLYKTNLEFNFDNIDLLYIFKIIKLS